MAIPRENSETRLITVYGSGTTRALTRGGNTAIHRCGILRRLHSLLKLGGLPRCVRSCSVSGLTNARGITNVVICGGNGPLGSTCEGFGVGNFRKRSSCTSVTRILAEQFSRCCGGPSRGRNFKGLPSLVLLSNNGNRITTMGRILRDGGVSIPLFNLMGSSGREAHTMANRNKRVTLDPKQSLFTFLTGVRSRIRHFTVNCRRSEQDGGAFGDSLANVRNVNRIETESLLGCFEAVRGVSGTSLTRLRGTPGVAGSTTLTICGCCRPRSRGGARWGVIMGCLLVYCAGVYDFGRLFRVRLFNGTMYLLTILFCSFTNKGTTYIL